MNILTRRNKAIVADKKFVADTMRFPAYEREAFSSEPRFIPASNHSYHVNPQAVNSHRAVIMCAGDLMCEPRMSKAVSMGGKFFFEQCFAPVRPVLQSADFAIANLETIVDEDEPYAFELHHVDGRYHCNAPVAYLDALRYAGFDGVVQANNHMSDGGADGLVSTIQHLDEKGLLHTGAFADEKQPRFMLVSVNGIKIAFLSYTEHVNANIDRKYFSDYGQLVMINRYDKDKLSSDIHAARAAGAEFIACYIHFRCKEYSHDVTDHQRALAQELADLGVDCVLGSHSHSLQPYDQVIGKTGRAVPVLFSLGNFITSDGTSMITRTNIIYKMVLERRGGKVEIAEDSYIPCRVVEGIGHSNYMIWPVSPKWNSLPNNTVLTDAREEIRLVMGEKLPEDGMTMADPAAAFPEGGPLQARDSLRQVNLLLGGSLPNYGKELSDMSVYYQRCLPSIRQVSDADCAIVALKEGENISAQEISAIGMSGVNICLSQAEQLLEQNDIRIRLLRFDIPVNAEDIRNRMSAPAAADMTIAYLISSRTGAESEELLHCFADAGVDTLIVANDDCLQPRSLVHAENGKVMSVYYPGTLAPDKRSWRTAYIFMEIVKKTDGTIHSRVKFVPENQTVYGKYGTPDPSRKPEASYSLNERKRMLVKLMNGEVPAKYMAPNGSTANMVPQLSIMNVCDCLGIPIPKTSYSLTMKRGLAMTKRSLTKGCIAVIRWTQDSSGKYIQHGAQNNSEYVSVADAVKAGAAVILTSVAVTASKQCTLLLPNGITAREAWKRLCRRIRDQYQPVTITITGNAGKTTTKDLVSAVLSAQYETLYVVKNFNTWRTSGEIIQNLQNYHEAYVQEVHEPDASDCSYMVHANASLITNIGKAHLDETGGSLESAREATLKILDCLTPGSPVFFNNNCPVLSQTECEKFNVIRYGTTGDNLDYWAENIENHGTNSTFTIRSRKGDCIDAIIHLPGEHNVLNALGAFAVGRWQNIDPSVIVSALSRFRAGGIRQNLTYAKGCTVVVDCYSTTILSSYAAAKTLHDLPVGKNGRRILVLGYLPKLGAASESVHREIAPQIAELKLDEVLCYRKDSKYIVDECQKYNVKARYFDYHKDLIEYMKKEVKSGDTVMFKSGTAAHLEQVANAVFGLKLVSENTMAADMAENGGSY